jgi:ATP-dependent Lhr-like helicase
MSTQADTAALDAWFAARGWQVLPFQREAWTAWAAGESGLVHAPTGAGKTLAVWGGPLLAAHARQQASPRAGKTRPLRVLWVTPLRALAADTHAGLVESARGLGLDLAILRRTGDSGSAERARLKRGECDVLVTTPESLALQLTYADAAERYAAVEAIIVDEWHELLGTKRGVLLELTLARIRVLAAAARPRVWGLSATLGNLDEAMRVLLGPTTPGRLIAGAVDKPIHIETLLPDAATRFPWAGHIGLSQLPRVLDAVAGAASTLVFTNTRAQAELWHQAIAAVWPDEPETLALHHGSLDGKLRNAVERGLAEGRMKCVVATSSLDLGVDFGAVDQVIQIGSPRGVARLMQRAGRSRHRPFEPCRMLMVPTHNLELVEIAAARRAIAAGTIEARRPLIAPIDVLAQHLATLATGAGFTRAEALAEVRRTHAYADIDDEAFDAALLLVTRGGRALGAYPDYQRVVDTDGVYRIASARVALRQRLSVGTIVADGHLRLKFERGASLGSIEESFIARLAPGDRFVFGGRVVELVRIRDMTAWVRRASGGGTVPRWMGGKMPLSTELAAATRALVAERTADEPEMRHARPMLDVQATLSHLPAADEVLVEAIRARDGSHVFFYPFAGRLAHEALGALLALRVARDLPGGYSFAVNDYGLVLSARTLPAVDEPTLARWLAPDDVAADLAATINQAELARRQFREVARVAGLVDQGTPGRGKSFKQLTQSCTLLYDVLAEHEPDHPLVMQAQREALAGAFDAVRVRAALAAIGGARLVLRAPPRLTPFALPLWAEGIRGHLSNEDWRERVERMAARLEQAA